MEIYFITEISNLHNLLSLAPHELQLAASPNYPATSTCKEGNMDVISQGDVG